MYKYIVHKNIFLFQSSSNGNCFKILLKAEKFV